MDMLEPLDMHDLSFITDPAAAATTCLGSADGINTTLTDTKLNICPRCGKAYKHYSHLVQHEKYECDKPPRFGCIYCPYRTKRVYDIRRHTRVMHPDREPRYSEQD